MKWQFICNYYLEIFFIYYIQLNHINKNRIKMIYSCRELNSNLLRVKEAY